MLSLSLTPSLSPNLPTQPLRQRNEDCDKLNKELTSTWNRELKKLVSYSDTIPMFPSSGFHVTSWKPGSEAEFKPHTRIKPGREFTHS